MQTMKSIFKSKPLTLVLPIAVLLSFGIVSLRWLFADNTRYVTGTVEATHVDVAAKIPARISQFLVQEGDRTNIGDALVVFESREVAAKVEQARAATAAAEAKYRMALNGARKEEVVIAEKSYQQAEWSVDVLKKTYDRMKSLHEEGVISTQQWDEVDYKYRAAVELRDGAKEKYLMTKSGARPEEKEATRSLFHQAQNVLAEAQSFYDETSLRAPISGVVEKKIVDEGELVAAGYPLLTLVDPSKWWVIVNVEEETIGELEVGASVSAILPSKHEQRIQMRVARISALSDFATKKATNELNSFDTRTFEVKLVPVDSTLRVHEGASVRVALQGKR